MGKAYLDPSLSIDVHEIVKSSTR